MRCTGRRAALHVGGILLEFDGRCAQIKRDRHNRSPRLSPAGTQAVYPVKRAALPKRTGGGVRPGARSGRLRLDSPISTIDNPHTSTIDARGFEMRSRRTLLWSTFFAAVLAAAAARGAAGPAVDHLSTGSREGQPSIRDVTGRALRPFGPAGVANVIFFIATDCPISNSYAPEIQRVCREYGPRGVGCSLMYEDVEAASSASRLEEEVRRHLREYRYANIPAAVDRSRVIAKHARATVTPEAVVIDRAGEIRYRGRIDNFYAALGKPRQQVTERDLRSALDAVLSGRPVPKVETEALGCYIVDPALLRK